MKVKNFFLYCGVGLACAGFVALSATKMSFAQSEISLEDFLATEEEPSQAELASTEEEIESSTVPAPVPEQISEDVVSEDDGQEEDVPEADSQALGIQNTPSPKNGVDALPPATTRLRVKTEGFDYVANKNIVADIDPGSNDLAYKTQEELAEEIRQEAFDAAITGLFPLRPEDIKTLLKEYDTTRRVVEEPINGIPVPQVNVETISLDPGVAPMSLKTSVGHITTLNILDVTGAPWPIQDVSWAGDFEVIEPEEGGHIIRIIPMGHSAYGNMSIRLLTLKTPVTIMLKTEKDVVQYRVDARIPEFGPFAQTPLIDGGSEMVAGNKMIMSVLDGAPPSNALKLDVGGVDGRTTAYKINNMTYVRTPLTLLSPGWEQSVSSADGMNVYALDETPILLLSDKGRFMRASLKEGKDLFDE